MQLIHHRDAEDTEFFISIHKRGALLCIDFVE